MTVVRFAGVTLGGHRYHGFPYSPVASPPPPPSGVGTMALGCGNPRVRGLTRGFIPPPPSGVVSFFLVPTTNEAGLLSVA